MNTASDALARSLANSAKFVLMITEDLKPEDYLHRPVPGANCAAWTLGHLVISGRSMMKRFGAADLPQFPEAFEAAYARDAQAPKADTFPHIEQLRPLFQQHHDQFVELVQSLPLERVNEKLEKPHPMFGTLGELAAFAPVHISMHAGQISTIRRSLGRAPMI
ncbi:MAG TPA: DinB family protein [Pirellulales bacterium]|nr:DinB family protein [Pirellulales bacterium]